MNCLESDEVDFVNRGDQTEPWDSPFIIEPTSRRQEKGCLPARDDRELFDEFGEALF